MTCGHDLLNNFGNEFHNFFVIENRGRVWIFWSEVVLICFIYPLHIPEGWSKMFTFLTKFNKKGSQGLVYLHVIFMRLMFVYQMN